MSSKRQLVVLLACLGVGSSAKAQEASEGVTNPSATAEPVLDAPAPPPAPSFFADAGPLPIEFHGYASQGYVISDHNNYFAYKSHKGSFRFTDVAVNATSQLTDRLRVVVQLASVVNDELNQPTVRLDFGFIDYHWKDVLGVRLGRFRLLTNLYTEVWDTDIARTPIFLPQSVYDPLGRLFFMNANGVQLYGVLRSTSWGSLDYVASVGALLPFGLSGATVDVHLLTSGRVTYTTPFSGLRFGGTWHFSGGTSMLPQSVTDGLVAAGALPPTYTGAIPQKFNDFYRCGAFAELALGNWMASAEYVRMYANVRTDDAIAAQVVLGQAIRQDGAYLMTSYRVTDWFIAGGYASFNWPDYRDRNSGPETHLHDYAATLRFDLNSYMALKLEGHRLIGTGGINADLNPTTTSDNGWLFATRVSAAF